MITWMIVNGLLMMLAVVCLAIAFRDSKSDGSVDGIGWIIGALCLGSISIISYMIRCIVEYFT